MGALDGVRVLDAGMLVQGPQAAALLADMGAEVIKVELPGFGDQSRWIPVNLTDRRAPYCLLIRPHHMAIFYDRPNTACHRFSLLPASPHFRNLL